MVREESHQRVFYVFIVLAIISRFFTFFNTVIDHDESTYLVFGQQLSLGAQLYVDIIDLKPPLGLWLFSGLYELFEVHIPLYRLFLALIIGTSAYFIYRIANHLGLSLFSSFLAGIFFILINLFHHALSFNLEHWMNFFTILSLFLFFRDRSNLSLCIASFFIGISFCIKYLSLLDFFSLYLVFAYYFWNSNPWKRMDLFSFLKQSALMTFSFVLPFLLVNLNFWFSENWEAFYFITYIAPGNYSSEVDFLSRMEFILDFHVNYAFYMLLFYMALFSSAISKELKTVLVIFLVNGLIACQLTGQFFPHYTIQCFFVISLGAGAIGEWAKLGKIRGYLTKHRLQFVVFLALATATFNYFDYYLENDPYGNLIEYLDAHVEDREEVLPINVSSVVNFKRKQTPRTPYVHSSLLFKDVHINTLAMEVDKEIQKYMSPPAPYLVIRDDEQCKEELDLFVMDQYQFEERFKKGLILYRLK